MDLHVINFNPLILGIFFTSIYCFIIAIFVIVYPDFKFPDVFVVLFLFFESLWLALGGVAAMNFGNISQLFLFKLSLLVYFFTILNLNFFFILCITPDFKLRYYHYLNLIGPAAAILLFFFEDYSSFTGDFLSLYYFSSDRMLLPAFSSLTLLFYFVYTLYCIIKIYRMFSIEFSNARKIIIWFALLNLGLTVLWVIDKIFTLKYLWHLYFISGCFPIIGSYLAIKYPNYLHMLQEILRPEKYIRSRINNIDPETALDELNTFMQSERPHLNSEINLAVLAERLDYSPHQFSELLNVHLRKNFSSFINYYRVMEAKGKIIAEPDAVMIKIAHDVGFESLASFNRAFKKETGETPTSYKKRIKEILPN